MIDGVRRRQLRIAWSYESHEYPDTMEWRGDLTKEEQRLIDKWDGAAAKHMKETYDEHFRKEHLYGRQ